MFTVVTGTNQRHYSQSLCMSCVKPSLKLHRVHFGMCCFTWGSRGILGKDYPFIISSLMKNIAECVHSSEKTFQDYWCAHYGAVQSKQVCKVNFSLQSTMQSRRKCGPKRISLKCLPVVCYFSFLSFLSFSDVKF